MDSIMTCAAVVVDRMGEETVLVFFRLMVVNPSKIWV